jgi:uncharacterized protein (TIGR02145 family)
MRSLIQQLLLIFSFFIVFSPVNGQELNELCIGNQIWLKTNLSVDTFLNGDKIIRATSAQEWRIYSEEKTPAYAVYNFDSVPSEGMGFLYNWYVISDSRGLVPNNWKIPEKEDFQLLLDFLGKQAAKKMKSSGYWENESCRSCSINGSNCGVCKEERRKENKVIIGNGDNSSGFGALPSGYIDINGFCQKMDNQTVFWTASDVMSSDELVYCLPIRFGFNDAYLSYDLKGMGFSLRLIKR